jgi:hypothetical protein
MSCDATRRCWLLDTPFTCQGGRGEFYAGAVLVAALQRQVSALVKCRGAGPLKKRCQKKNNEKKLSGDGETVEKHAAGWHA